MQGTAIAACDKKTDPGYQENTGQLTRCAAGHSTASSWRAIHLLGRQSSADGRGLEEGRRRGARRLVGGKRRCCCGEESVLSANGRAARSQVSVSHGKQSSSPLTLGGPNAWRRAFCDVTPSPGQTDASQTAFTGSRSQEDGPAKKSFRVFRPEAAISNSSGLQRPRYHCLDKHLRGVRRPLRRGGFVRAREPWPCTYTPLIGRHSARADIGNCWGRDTRGQETHSQRILVVSRSAGSGNCSRHLAFSAPAVVVRRGVSPKIAVSRRCLVPRKLHCQAKTASPLPPCYLTAPPHIRFLPQKEY